ncbi:hypothetical protein R1flu_014954 [Riccia fluitans]|uniref:Ribosomal protein S14 n=1 Tax=Riccia fluitans TaxID=41844 RepID=A0ABD1YHV2_9MARC
MDPSTVRASTRARSRLCRQTNQRNDLLSPLQQLHRKVSPPSRRLQLFRLNQIPGLEFRQLEGGTIDRCPSFRITQSCSFRGASKGPQRLLRL